MRKQERPKHLRRDASGDEEDKDVFDDDDASAGSVSSDDDVGISAKEATTNPTVSPKGACSRGGSDDLPTAEGEVEDREAGEERTGERQERQAEDLTVRPKPTWQLIKEDPSFVPRGSSYFLHDDRGEVSGEEVETDEERRGRSGATRAFADVSSDESFHSDDIPRSTQIRLGKPRKLWTPDEAGQDERDKWVHDCFESLLQEGGDRSLPPLRSFHRPRPRFFRRAPNALHARGRRGAPAPRGGRPRRSRDARGGSDVRGGEETQLPEARGQGQRGERNGDESEKRESETQADATSKTWGSAAGADGDKDARPAGQPGGTSNARGQGRGRRRRGRAPGVTTAYVVKGEQQGPALTSTGESERSHDHEKSREFSQISNRPRGRRGGSGPRTGERTEWTVRMSKPAAAPVST
uniref:CASC3/barentsz eIF4AIII-binding protein n=2 Tax=Toxoplasma gondii TaxID=5811 RepID=A0A2G8Y841_TOXGO|nr:CASC3/barentsz eIF4AIII-binding protein [Toxoplasma gondii COUG]